MPWTQATFTNRSGKPARVWVETDDAGALVVSDGTVGMRYKDAEDAKVYNASAARVALDGAEPVATKKKQAPSSRPAANEDVWRAPQGELIVSDVAPSGLESAASETPDGTVDAWTDGGCSGNPGPCGYGVVLLHGDTYREVSQFIGVGTNNIAELLAIGVALREARGIEGRLRIHTDSKYAIGVLSKGWKAKANTELIAHIKERLQQRGDVTFVKVAGHSGIPLNERADELATTATERGR